MCVYPVVFVCCTSMTPGDYEYKIVCNRHKREKLKKIELCLYANGAIPDVWTYTGTSMEGCLVSHRALVSPSHYNSYALFDFYDKQFCNANALYVYTYMLLYCIIYEFVIGIYIPMGKLRVQSYCSLPLLSIIISFFIKSYLSL